MFKVNNEDNRMMGAFTVNFEEISHLFLELRLLTLNR